MYDPLKLAKKLVSIASTKAKIAYKTTYHPKNIPSQYI